MFDGSLGDIYVLETTRVDWTRLLARSGEQIQARLDAAEAFPGSGEGDRQPNFPHAVIFRVRPGDRG